MWACLFQMMDLGFSSQTSITSGSSSLIYRETCSVYHRGQEKTEVYQYVFFDDLISFIILRLAPECSPAIFTLQRYQQAYSEPFVSSVSANHLSDWLKDFICFSLCICLCLSELSRENILPLLFTSCRMQSFVAK